MHVPWKKETSEDIPEADLPAADDKWKMYSLGTELLRESGYKALAWIILL